MRQSLRRRSLKKKSKIVKSKEKKLLSKKSQSQNQKSSQNPRRRLKSIESSNLSQSKNKLGNPELVHETEWLLKDNQDSFRSQVCLSKESEEKISSHFLKKEWITLFRQSKDMEEKEVMNGVSMGMKN